jgi:hypothetical protein
MEIVWWREGKPASPAALMGRMRGRALRGWQIVEKRLALPCACDVK